MATNTKKKKSGLVERLMFGDDNKPDLTPELMNVSKWGMFKYVFFHRFGSVVLLNLLTLIFALPTIVVMILVYMNSTVAAGHVPYSANLGIGITPIPIVDAISQGEVVTFSYDVFMFTLLIPCVALFAVGLVGNMYVMRKFIWDEQTRTVKDFFRGIKKCWLPALLIGILFGMTLLLVVFSLGFFDAYHLSTALKVVSITFSIILLVFMILFTSFFLTQTAAFKMKGTVLIRNSVLFVLGTNIQAILFIGIAIAPVFLVLVPGITMLLVMLFGFVGFSYTSLVITLYCHHCYEKLLYDKVSGKPTAKYAKRSDDDGDDKTKKKTKTAQYKEPKKRKRSIDEGSDITPLTPTFRREDLERLQKEHEQVMLESEEVEIDEDSDEKAGAPDKAAVEAAASETAPEEKAGESRPAQNKADKKPQKSGGKGKKG